MEQFTIHCTTCKARLVVKDPSLIGDILSCPKCHSMVQVVPPVGWTRPGAEDSSPGELPASESVASATEPAAPAQSPAEPAPAAVPPALPARAQAEPTVDASAATSQPISAPPATRSLLAAALSWAGRDWLVIAAGLGGGVVLGAIVWLVVGMRASGPPTVVEQPAPTAAAVPAESDTQDSPPATTAAPVDDTESETSVAAPKEPDPVVPPVTELARQPASPPQTDMPVAAKPAEDQSAAQPPAADATAQPGGRALRLDPIRAGDSSPDLSGLLPSTGSTQDEPLPLEPTAAVEEPAEVADQPGAELPVKTTPLSPTQIEQRLGAPLAGVEFSDVALSQFAAFISDVTGVPVVLDEAAGKLRPNLKISVTLEATSAGAALRAALEAAGLAMAVRDGRIVITHRGA